MATWWSSCRLKRLSQHFYSASLLSRVAPVKMASQTILMVVSCFLFVYWVDFTFSFSVVLTWRTNPLLVWFQIILVNSYATISPLVLIRVDKWIFKILQTLWGRSNKVYKINGSLQLIILDSSQIVLLIHRLFFWINSLRVITNSVIFVMLTFVVWFANTVELIVHINYIYRLWIFCFPFVLVPQSRFLGPLSSSSVILLGIILLNIDYR